MSAPIQLICSFREATCNITISFASSPLVALLGTAALSVDGLYAGRKFAGTVVWRLLLCAVFAFLAKPLDKQSGGLVAANALTVAML